MSYGPMALPDVWESVLTTLLTMEHVYQMVPTGTQLPLSHIQWEKDLQVLLKAMQVNLFLLALIW